jgi:hypothetical protein
VSRIVVLRCQAAMAYLGVSGTCVIVTIPKTKVHVSIQTIDIVENPSA